MCNHYYWLNMAIWLSKTARECWSCAQESAHTRHQGKLQIPNGWTIGLRGHGHSRTFIEDNWPKAVLNLSYHQIFKTDEIDSHCETYRDANCDRIPQSLGHAAGNPILLSHWSRTTVRMNSFWRYVHFLHSENWRNHAMIRRLVGRLGFIIA